MNTLDDLHDSLDRYAERGDARGDAAVWAAAELDASTTGVADGLTPTGSDARSRVSESGRSRRALLLVGAAAAVVLLIGVVAAVRVDRSPVDVHTSPSGTAPGSTAPRDLRPIVVPGGAVATVLIAADRIWVASPDPTTVDGTGAHLRSFAIDSGEVLSDVAVKGTGMQLVATDAHVWLLAGFAGTVTSESDRVPDASALLRIDPTTGATEPVLELVGDGAIAAARDRVAVADERAVTVVGDDGSVLGSSTIEELTEGSGSTDGGSVTGLAFFQPDPGSAAPTSLFAVHAQRRELLELDPTSARWRTGRAVPVDPSYSLGPWVTVSGGYVWVGSNSEGYGAPGHLAGAMIPLRDPEYQVFDRTVEVDMALRSVEPLGETRVVATSEAEAVVDNGTSDPITTPIEARAASAIVFLDGLPWVARWTSGGEDRTVVSFVRVRTDASTPEPATTATIEATTTTTTVPASPPTPTYVSSSGGPAVLTITSPQPLRDGQTVNIAAAGLPAGAVVTFSVCPVTDRVGTGSCWQPMFPDPLPTATVGVNAGFGELFTEWTATRSSYDDRWHDCAVETCVLRVYGVDEAGRRDTGLILAEAPIAFADDGPPIRPTLTVDPAGPIAVQSTARIRGSGFPGGRAGGVTIGLCATGREQQTCRFDLASMYRPVGSDGTVTASYTPAMSTIAMPALDGAGNEVVGEVIDCSVEGTCGFAFFPDASSREPYAVVPVTILP